MISTQQRPRPWHCADPLAPVHQKKVTAPKSVRAVAFDMWRHFPLKTRGNSSQVVNILICNLVTVTSKLEKWKLFLARFVLHCTIASKINGTTKGVYLPISKIHWISSFANLLTHNNICQICYWGQISLQSVAVNCCFSDNLTPLGVKFILLAMVQCTCLCSTLYFAP